MTITLRDIEKILKEHDLLKEFTYESHWFFNLPVADRTLTHITYDSRTVTPDSLFFCKGFGFKEEYLQKAMTEGLEIYVSEEVYDTQKGLGIIVTNVRQAMAVLSMAFYDNPQDKLTLIAYTGTKGKTTCAYFTKFILDHHTDQKTAIFSTMNTSLDGKTYFKSALTTPESIDLYRMMQEAVDNGMTHLIMEVSSQAYKVERVYNLMFDVGIFLNISPDHISPIEHPTFDDYYYCKRQLIRHSKQMVLNVDCQDYTLLKEMCEDYNVPYLSYGSQENHPDVYWTQGADDALSFDVATRTESLPVNPRGNYRINLMGDFNKDNAVASILASQLAGATVQEAQLGLGDALVPGRMEQLTHKNGARIFVDYAHNYVSLQQLLSFAKADTKGRIITVLGSPGDKSISRRADFGHVLSELTDVVILTADDPGHESPEAIAQEISAHITTDRVEQVMVMDREEAIHRAIEMSQSGDSVIIAGKGRDAYQKVNGVDEPYLGDYTIAEGIVGK